MEYSKITAEDSTTQQPPKGKGLPSPDDAIGRRIRNVREERQLNVSQLAELTKNVSGDGKGLSRAVIAGYENGDYKPGTRELRILCSALNVSPNWLVFGQEQLSNPATSIGSLLDDELPEMGIAKLLFILTSLSEEEFHAVATLLVAFAKRDKALKAALSNEADVMGRLIGTSMVIESSSRWSKHVGEHLNKTAKKPKGSATKSSSNTGEK